MKSLPRRLMNYFCFVYTIFFIIFVVIILGVTLILLGVVMNTTFVHKFNSTHTQYMNEYQDNACIYIVWKIHSTFALPCDSCGILIMSMA